jgi:signal transduction histidine kinase
MKRLKWLMLFFGLAISIPLGYVIWHTYQGLAQEERSQLRFFSETLFDEIQKEMADLVRREEDRAVDEYNYTLAQDTGSIRKSPLSQPPGEDYILGYLQNNPDGSFQTPLVADLGRVPAPLRPIVARLKEANTIFNSKKLAIQQTPAVDKPKMAGRTEAAPPKKEKAAFADRYISKSQQQESKSYLGQKSTRTEEITVGQALNLSREDRDLLRASPQLKQRAAAPAVEMDEQEPVERLRAAPGAISVPDSESASIDASAAGLPAGRYAFQAEVAPLQSLLISDGTFFIFRRIAINNQIFRQGFVLQIEPFLRHLSARHFDTQPMAAYTGLTLEVVANGHPAKAMRSGHWNVAGDFITRRSFPAPFDFLSASMQAVAIPPSPVRRPLDIALAVLGSIMFLGLIAIYQSARTVVDLSERRSQFVSSVTHELKTPLTNIRMYIEMLEQGIAASPQREQDYLQILSSESARLSRLINNVLELAKLEKKQRHFDLSEGRLDDVLSEVQSIMGHKLKQEGFKLEIKAADVPAFAFDREVLIQILINLIENSIKFGRMAPRKAISITADHYDQSVRIAIADSGPGIPAQALKKVFDDFYRVDNDLTRTTGGTGIGLALVKKFVSAMGGRVLAANNSGPGCTITLLLPLNRGTS